DREYSCRRIQSRYNCRKKIIIELKAVQNLIPIHETQLVNYLTATNTDHGLLINFGGERIEIKRKFREYKHKE
ncbi:GxxExxY protein, partial [Bacteroides cellulosilyticus]|uniref:GxxExxY protein n=1 Tax=Bacteroides cellulosilyticus TaxID=246787 RepID=UPI00397781E9